MVNKNFAAKRQNLKISLKIILVGFSILMIWRQNVVFAQKSEQIELIRADVLEGGVHNGEEFRKLSGNVVFKHDETFMYCDLSYHYANKNTLEAFGHIKIQQGDTLTLTGDSLFYDGNAKIAKVRGNITLIDNQMTLTTSFLDYDMKNKLAWYFNGGDIIDDENHLSSEFGYYDTGNKIVSFKNNVSLINPEYDLKSDTLLYNTATKIAYFKGPTDIITGNSRLYAEDGEYNTNTKISIFSGNAKLETPDYILEGDSLYYEEINDFGIARYNVKLISKEDNIIIEGDIGKYWGKKGLSKVYGIKYLPQRHEDTKIYQIDSSHSIEEELLHTDTLSPVLPDSGESHQESPAKIKKHPIRWEKSNSDTFPDTVVHPYGAESYRDKLYRGNALMKYIMENDTMYLVADTFIFKDYEAEITDTTNQSLIHGTKIDTEYSEQNPMPDTPRVARNRQDENQKSITSAQDKNQKSKRIFAYNNVLMYNGDIQGKCDSAVFVFDDSTIFFYNNPIIWSENSQLTADSINIRLANNQIDKMNMRINSFIISMDSLLEFNQVKGKNMTAWFKDNAINKVYVDGNGESIYFVLEEDTNLVGMNKVLCSNMIIIFEENKVKVISFLNNPEARFIPPHEIEEPGKKLKGFKWRIEDKPVLKDLVHFH